MKKKKIKKKKKKKKKNSCHSNLRTNQDTPPTISNGQFDHGTLQERRLTLTITHFFCLFCIFNTFIFIFIFSILVLDSVRGGNKGRLVLVSRCCLEMRGFLQLLRRSQGNYYVIFSLIQIMAERKISQQQNQFIPYSHQERLFRALLWFLSLLGPQWRFEGWDSKGGRRQWRPDRTGQHGPFEWLQQ